MPFEIGLKTMLVFPSHDPEPDAMAKLHDLEVQTEGRVQVINYTTINPHGD